jgi:transcriptional regulator with XRE-family HTH domain
MSRIRKSKEEAQELGASLHQRRKRLCLTLLNLKSAIGVDVGQLSRFERGDFKIVSKNLQKLINYLQIMEGQPREQPELVHRFAEILTRSQRHEAAARALVLALESLQ